MFYLRLHLEEEKFYTYIILSHSRLCLIVNLITTEEFLNYLNF